MLSKKKKRKVERAVFRLNPVRFQKNELVKIVGKRGDMGYGKTVFIKDTPPEGPLNGNENYLVMFTGKGNIETIMVVKGSNLRRCDNGQSV